MGARNFLAGLACLALPLAGCGREAEHHVEVPEHPVGLPGPGGAAQDDPPPAPVADPPPGSARHALDGVLRLNEIQMKGSHNSYHVASTAKNAPAWSQYTLPPLAEQAELHGVRQFELDIHLYAGQFLVFHLPGIDQDSTCPTLRGCLRELVAWSNRNPGHHPLVVWLELKDEWDPVKIAPNIEALEAEVRDTIPAAKLVTPDDVRRGYATIKAAIENHGWPTLGETRGKLMLVVMDEGAGRWAYTRGGATLDGRAMFVTEQSGGHGVVAMIDDVLNQEAAVYQAAAQGLLVRSRVDDLPGNGAQYELRLEVALRAGAHMLATDYPEANAVPGYEVRIPGGSPSRCNPVTARPGCEALLIENPALLSGDQ